MVMEPTAGDRQELLTDLAAFADPGVRIVSEVDGSSIIAVWERNGTMRRATFKRSSLPQDGGWSVEMDDAHLTYRTFLSGPLMADLAGIARNTPRVIEAVEDYVASPVVAGQGVLTFDEAYELATGGDGRTVLLFVTANAGVGKTSLLRSVVRSRASQYSVGESGTLWLYVNAQGSSLAKLEQALAASLDDVRAQFAYHAVPTLVRSGVVVPVIDGFDELIGTTGSYDEAFSSLATFLNALNGRGVVVAAARSTYFDQEFLTRVGKSIGFTSGPWQLQTVSLQDWGPAERATYVSRRAASREMNDEEAELLTSRVETAFNDDPQLRSLAGVPLL